MYKFFGRALKEVPSASSGNILFRFDKNGEFITDDEDLIERAKLHFNHMKIVVASIGKKVMVTNAEHVGIVITNNLEVAEKENPSVTVENFVGVSLEKPIETPKEKQEIAVNTELPQLKVIACKKCDFTCTSQGDILAHYRKSHPKIK